MGSEKADDDDDHAEDQNTDDASGVENTSSVQAEDNSIAVGRISAGGNVGDIRIGHTIGFTSDQVSVLLSQITSTLQPKLFDGRCPYKGLDVFEEEDADLFFWRERPGWLFIFSAMIMTRNRIKCRHLTSCISTCACREI